MKMILFILALLIAAPAWAQDDANPIYPPACGSVATPNSAGCSGFGTSLYTYLTKEKGGEDVEYGFSNFIYTGTNAAACEGVTGAGLTMTPTACIGYNAGIRGTENGSITFPNSSTCWVAMDQNTSGSNSGLPNFTRSAGTHYLYDCTDVSAPTMPADAQLTMLVVTSGGAITSVTDERTTAPTPAVVIAPRTVAQGGTGRTTLTIHDLLVGNGTSAVTMLACANNMFLAGVTSADPACRAILASDVPGFDSVTVTGTPSAGQVPRATSSSAATWQNVTNRSNLQTGNPLATISNSTTETTLYTYSLAGGTLTSAGTLRCRVEGNYLNNTGGNATMTWKFYYGGSAILTASAIAATGANPVFWTADITLSTIAATNAEWASIVITYPSTGVADNTSSGLVQAGSRTSTAAVDSTASQTVKLTGTMTSATATQTLTSYTGYCQLQ